MTKQIPRTVTVNVDSREKTIFGVKLPEGDPDRWLRRVRQLFPGFVRWWAPDARVHNIRIHIARAALETADMALASPWEEAGLIERKGSMTELYSNVLTGDYRRFRRELERIAATGTRATLLFDFPYGDSRKVTTTIRNPERVLDGVYREIARYKLSHLWPPTARDPRHTGEYCVRWLLAGAYVRYWNGGTWNQRIEPYVRRV